jgi:hypothetical protein
MSAVLTNAADRVPGFVEDLVLLRVPPWWQSPWVLVPAALAAGVGLVCAWRTYRRWVDRTPVTAPAPPRPAPGEPPELWALRRLDELRAQREQLGGYRLAIECSQVLRRYLEARFTLPILYQTTREFLAAAQTSAALAPAAREALGQYLAFCDRVKFGRRPMTEPERTQMVEFATAFVRTCQQAATGPPPPAVLDGAPAEPVTGPTRTGAAAGGGP